MFSHFLVVANVVIIVMRMFLFHEVNLVHCDVHHDPILIHDNNFHNITQLLGYVPWDHVSHEHRLPFSLGFPVYGEHSGYIL